MTEATPATNPLFTNEVVYRLPWNGEVNRNISYGSGARTLDIYYPQRQAEPGPVVVFVTGYPDPGFESMTGMKQKQIPSYQSWSKLVAASGMAAVTYSAEEPQSDIIDLIFYLKQNSELLNIDAQRIAIWSCSGNVANALNVMVKETSLAGAVLCYGLTMDLDHFTSIRDAAQQFRFTNPLDGKNEFPTDVPLLLIRAGKDEIAGLNESMDRFVGECLVRNCDVEVINFPCGVHGFDILDSSDDSISIIKRQLEFLKNRLSA